jgi:uncharacterized phiE125 gp8 family phage protein
MPLSEKLFTPPYAEPVHLDEMKLHLRVDGTADDALITSTIRVAREHVETVTQRQLVGAVWKLYLDEFPCGCCNNNRDMYADAIRLGHSPLLSVKSIQYVDVNGATQTLSTSVYTVDANTEPARIMLAYNQVWPPTRPQANAVTVTFYAGHAVPFLGSAIADRATLQIGDLVSDNPFSVGEVWRLSNTGGTLPMPLTTYTNYTIGTVTNSTATFKDTSGDPVDLTTNGTGINFIGEVPEPMRQCMKLLCGEMYANREASTAAINKPTMDAVSALLWPLRVMEMA